MDLKKLRDALKGVVSEMEALDEKTIDEKGNVRSFSEDEQSKYDELEERAKSLRGSIKRAEERAEASATVERLSAAKGDGPKIQVVREEHCNEEGEYRGFHNLGDQLMAVKRSEYGAEDKRLTALRKHAQARAAAGHNETEDSKGGFLVQTDFVAELQREALASSSIANLCRSYPVSSNANAVNYVTTKEDSRADGSRNGGVQAYWMSEAGSFTSSTAELEQHELRLEKLGCLTYVTEEMLQDSALLGSWVRDLYVDEMSFKIDSAIIEGDGAGKPQGISNSAALVSVAKKSGQAADTIVAENVVKMLSRMLPAGRSRAVWLINYEVEEQLPLMTIGDQPVYLPAGSLTNQPHATLLGRPVIVAEACEKLGDQGDIYLADFSRYMLAQKAGIKGDVSIHVKFESAQTAFRWYTRINGQSMLRTAVTPYKGNTSQKLSYFVTLNART